MAFSNFSIRPETIRYMNKFGENPRLVRFIRFEQGYLIGADRGKEYKLDPNQYVQVSKTSELT